MPTSRRSGPGDKPRRPRVAGTRNRITPGKYGVSGSDRETTAGVPNSEVAVSTEQIHRGDNGIPPAAKPADPVTESIPTESVDHPDPTVDTGDSADAPISEWETVAARPVIDDTDVVADPTADFVVKTDEMTVQDTESVGAPAQVESPTKRPLVTAVLLLLTVVCGALSFWFFSEQNALRNEGPAANHALTDAAATSEVNGMITTAVQQTFSYDFANTAKTENAAKNLLVGPAIQQYNDLYAIVKQLAPQQKLVLTTTVQASAVTMLQGDRAQVLLIVSQNDTRTDTGQSNSDTAQLSIGAVKQGNQWKIEQITQR